MLPHPLVPKVLQKDHLIFLHNKKWPTYPLGENEMWSCLGSLKYNAVFQLFKKHERWAEVPYVQAFMALYQRPDLCPRTNPPPGTDAAEDSLSSALLPSLYLLTSLLSQYPQEIKPSPSLGLPTTGPQMQGPQPVRQILLYPLEEWQVPMVPFRCKSLFQLQICSNARKNKVDSLRTLERFTDGFHTITMVFDLTGQDVQFILVSCCIAAERKRTVKAAKQANDWSFHSFASDNRSTAVLFGPQEGPEWHYNIGCGENKFKLYTKDIFVGMWQGMPKPVNYNKLSFISWSSDENPAAFQIWLEALRKYINLDLEPRDGQITLGHYFNGQWVLNIRKKFQKL